MNATAEGRHALAAARLRYALRRRRWQLGLSQQQVADAMGYTGRGVVCDWEVGRRTPQLASLIGWCDALGTKLTISIDDEAGVSDG